MGLTLNQETSDRVSEVATDHPFSVAYRKHRVSSMGPILELGSVLVLRPTQNALMSVLLLWTLAFNPGTPLRLEAALLHRRAHS